MRKDETKANTTYLSIDHYKNLNLRYNPFSYLNDQELFFVTKDRIDVEKIAARIEDCSSCFVEFYGNKGQGKSTHLQLLYYKYFPETTFFKLKKGQAPSVDTTSGILIIDSFQLLSIKNKLELLNKQKKLIITSHNSYSFLSSKREYNKKVNFNKLNLTLDFLEKIVTTRIEIARIDRNKPIPKIKMKYLEILLKRHGNHLRNVQSHLYQKFIDLNHDFYEL